jgi:transcriptional regulator with XRE-family HTH domain
MSNTERSMSLGQSVRQRRLAAGLTQSELAEAAEIADATLSRIERDRLEPSITLVQRLAKALGVSTDELLHRPKAPKKPAMRQCEARLLGAVRGLDDAAVDDIARSVRLILAVGRRTAGGRRS